MTSHKPKVVVLGGGTGCFVTLTGLKKYDIDLTAIVAMTDSGGSTGRLRDQLGVLPPGDLRQALVALSDSPELWRDLFAFRFENGDLSGHNFGNIFISTLERMTGSIEEAISKASELLDVNGNVVPVTFSKCTLCAKYEDGSLIEGEKDIDSSLTKRPRIRYLYLEPDASINPKAAEEIEKADYIVIPPGDLYTSVFPIFLVAGVTDSINKSKAKKIYCVNLMTKLGQTDDFAVSDHVYETERYLGSFLDYVIVNSKGPDEELLDWYLKQENVEFVDDDLDTKHVTEAKIIRANLLNESKFEQSVADRVRRSLIRHDSDKLAKVLMNIISNHQLTQVVC